MNEHIKLPAQEWLGYDPERGDLHGYTFEQMRQFAELIVRECVMVADHSNVTGKSIIGERIREHFGVEEK
jgi:hypothetical protein